MANALALANQLVTKRAGEDFRQATERILGLIKKRGKTYRKNPSRNAAELLAIVVEWSEHIRRLCDCSCADCWQQGASLIAIVDRLERGEYVPFVDAGCSSVKGEQS